MRGAAHQLLFLAVFHFRQVRQVFRFVLLCLDVRAAVKMSRGTQQNAEKVHTPASHGARLTQISFLRWPTSLPQQHGASVSILLYTAEESRNCMSCDVTVSLSRGSILSWLVTCVACRGYILNSHMYFGLPLTNARVTALLNFSITWGFRLQLCSLACSVDVIDH